MPRVAVVWAVFLVSLAVTASGLIQSDVLRRHLWPGALADQAILLAAVATLGAGIGRPLLPIIIGIAIALCFGAGPALAGAIVLASCLVTGIAVLRITRTDLDDGPTVAAVGIGATILLLTGAGIAQLPMPLVFWLLLGAALACVLLSADVRRRLAALSIQRDTGGFVCTAVILFEVLFLTGNAAMPERYYDALAMHLLIPTQVLTFGHWNYDPALAFAFFPIGADYLFAFAFAVGGELAAKLLNLAALLLAAALLFDIVRACHGRHLGAVAVMLFLGIPVTLIVTASLFVENVLCLLTTATLWLLLRGDRAALIGLAIVLPALTAVKLHGVLIAVSGAAIALAGIRIRRNDWTVLAGVAAIAGTLGALTYVYAWVRTGNPIFPLMNDIFRSPFWPPVAFADGRYVGHLAPDLLYRMTFETGRYLESHAGALGFAFIALLAAGIVATLLSPTRPVVVALLIASFYIAVVLAEEQYVRYLYPVFPLLLVVCMHGLSVMARIAWLRPLLVGSVAAVALLDIAMLPSAGWILSNTDFRALFDPDRRLTMLRDQVPERLANEAINVLSASAPRVIYASDPYGALLRGTPIYTNWYNPAFTADADIAGHRPTFAVVDTTSSQPLHRRVGQYAEAHGRLIDTIGRLRLYRFE